MVFCHAVILTGSSIEAVADTQDGIEQGARELITHPDCQLDGLCAEERPRQQAITCNREQGGHILHDIFIHVNIRDGYKATASSFDVKKATQVTIVMFLMFILGYADSIVLPVCLCMSISV